MAFDFKKEYRELYHPKSNPTILEVPRMNFVAVKGSGNPNEEDGEYANAIKVLYAISYTLRMIYKSDYKINGYYEYVVPPLEGFWWQEGLKGYDMSRKDDFSWISLIRLPEFVSEEDFNWAVNSVQDKKGIDCSKAYFFSYEEGLCLQMMHLGPYDAEIETVKIMDKYLEDNGYRNDFSNNRWHHEIYISDPRKSLPEKMKTVIRHPIIKE